MALSPGIHLGPYEILSPLGAGGMGEVWRARDTRLGRDVAVKVLPDHFAGDPKALRRFKTEARAVAALSHPNILSLFDVGEVDGIRYAVTELLEGEPLRALVIRGPVPVKRALEIAQQVADALAAAHERGIVHRDVKPENVFLTKDGRAKVLDFGLAHHETSFRDPDDSHSPTLSALTEAGAVVGTVAYMSPEQARGLPVDHRSDQFSLGVVLYEMLAGKRPFRGEDGASLISAILRDEPEPLASSAAAVPEPVSWLAARLLAKEPPGRYESTRDLTQDLALCRARLSGPASTATAQTGVAVPSRPRLALIATAVAVLLAATGIGFRVFRTRPEGTKAAAPALDPKRVGVAGGADAASRKDPVHILAEETGAGTVVSGSYYLSGSNVEIQAKVTDVTAGKLLYPIELATAPREKAREAVEAIQRQVLDVVAARFLDESWDLLSEGGSTPRIEAYVETLKGDGVTRFDAAASLGHYRRAVELDPEFNWARLALAFNLYVLGQYSESDRQLARLELVKGKLTPTVRRDLEVQRANLGGRVEELFGLLVDAKKSHPGFYKGLLADSALASNRPTATLEILRRPLGWEKGFKPEDPVSLLYFMRMTGALHQLGEHEAELKEARRGRGFYPALLNAWAYEARALVALGRLNEVEGLVVEATSLPPRWGYESCCMPRGTPGFVMLVASEELRVHGNREASIQMAGRAVDWHRGRTGSEAAREDNKSRLGEALYRAEMWPEARVVFEALAARNQAHLGYRGWLGVIAARGGRSNLSRRIAAELGIVDAKYLFGEEALWRARILALLGERDSAVAQLREAVARGGGLSKEHETYGYGFRYPHLMDLETLRGYALFEELVKPKG